MFQVGEGPQLAELGELVAQAQGVVTAGLAAFEWAELEIEQAIKRHPDAEGDLQHSFSRLVPTIISPAWSTEFVYRGHWRELLERIATGQDTRPGTAAECALACRGSPKRSTLSRGVERLLLPHVA